MCEVLVFLTKPHYSKKFLTYSENIKSEKMESFLKKMNIMGPLRIFQETF